MPLETTLLTKSESKNPRRRCEVTLQLKVSNKSNSKTQSIDLGSFKMQFLTHCYYTQAKIRKDDS